MIKVALIIDPQIDFIWGSLAVEGAVEAMNNTAIELFKGDYNYTIITKDWHPKNHCSFKENNGEWPVHCVKDTEGAKIYPGLQKVLSNLCSPYEIFTKGENPNKEEYSVLENPVNKLLLENFLDDNWEIHIFGIAGDFCVKYTIEDLINMGYKDKIIIHKNCVASIDTERFNKYIEEKCLTSC